MDAAAHSVKNKLSVISDDNNTLKSNIILLNGKMKSHLDLLRDEYSQLQTKFVELQRRYDLLAASKRLTSESEDINKNDDESASGFIQKLVSVVSQLYEKDLYRYVYLHIVSKFIY